MDVQSFMADRLKKARDKCTEICCELSSIARIIRTLHLNGLYYVKYRAKLIPGGRVCEHIIQITEIHADEKELNFVFKAVCDPDKNDVIEERFSYTWHISHWIGPCVMELREISVKDLPLYVTWHKSSLYDKLLKGEI